MKDPKILEFKTWLIQVKGLGDRTAHTYAKAVNSMLKRKTMTAALRDQRAASTKQLYWAVLKQWATFIDDQELLDELSSPTIRRIVTKTGEPPRPVEPYSEAEVEQFRTALDSLKDQPNIQPWVWPSISLLMRLALRARVDLCRLTKKDLVYGLKSGRLTLRTKRDKLRILPTSAVTDEIQRLTRLGNWTQLSDLIAPDSLDSEMLAYRHIVKILKQIAQACGMDPTTIRSHRFRHTAAMEFYKASGHDIQLVQKFLGHSRLDTTVGYLRLDRTEEIGDVLDRIKSATG